MSAAIGWALAGAGLGALAIGLDPASLARWLDPSAGITHHEAIVRGVEVVRGLLGVDALVFFGLALRGARGSPRGEPARARVPLWRPPPAEPEPPRGVAWGIAIGIGLAALVLRGIGLESDLWMDEVGTLVLFVRRGFGQILTDFSDDNQHLLYSLLARVSVGALGEGATELRLPALAFGLASLWAVARLGRLMLSWREGWLAAALLAFSYHHIWFSQNARAYTLLLFATLLATELFLRGLAHPRPRTWVAYATTIALAAWAHLTMVFVALAHALVALGLLARERSLRDGRAWPLAGVALAAWLTLHAYALIVPQVFAFFTAPATAPPGGYAEWTHPWWLVTETLHHLGVGLVSGGAGVLAVSTVGGLGVWRCARRDPWVTALMLLPAVIELMALIALGRSLRPRFFFHLLGFAALIAVAGALEAGDLLARRASRRRSLVAALPALALLAISAASVPRVYLHPKQDYTGARDFVRARLAPGDRVVGLHVAGEVYRDYYARDWAEATTVEDLERHRARNGRTWVLYTLPSYLQAAYPELMRLIETEFEHVRTFPGTLSDGEIIVVRSKNSGSAGR